MKCLNNKLIFDFINKELNEMEFKDISIHIKDCEQCQKKYELLKEQIQLVNNTLTLLEPTRIPQKSFVSSESKSKEKDHKIKNIRISIFDKWLEIRFRKSIVISGLSICLILYILFIHHSHHDYLELSRNAAAIELSFLSNPKQDINEKSFFISIFNENEKQIEIIKTSINGNTISRNIIDLK